jgi:hypothetical protein
MDTGGREEDDAAKQGPDGMLENRVVLKRYGQ